MKWYDIIIFIILLVIIIGIIIFLIKGWPKKKSGYLGLCATTSSIGLFVAALYGFYVTWEATRMQTSMDFCTYIYPTLQSEEFV